MTTPITYDYYYQQQYYKFSRGKLFVWRVDEWILSNVIHSDVRKGKEKKATGR